MKKNERGCYIDTFGLTFLVLILTLISAEILLRGGGFLYKKYRLPGIRSEDYAASEYTILCVGDSFTFGLGAAKGEDYPRQLYSILKKEIPHKNIVVVNEGIPGQNSSRLIESLDNLLTRYTPDMIVVMTGANDRAYVPKSYALSGGRVFPRWFSDLRLVKLFSRCRSMIGAAKRKSQREKPQHITMSPEEENAFIEKAEAFFSCEEGKEAEKILLQGINEDNFYALVNLSAKYNRGDIVEKLIRKRLQQAYDEWAHTVLGGIYADQGKYKEAETIYRDILERNPDNNWIRRDLGKLLIKQKKFDEAESILRQQIEKFSDIGVYWLLAREYEQQGADEKRDEAYKTFNAYRPIVDVNIMELYKNRILPPMELVVMSYPEFQFLSREIVEYLSQQPDVMVIDNRKIFERFGAGAKKDLFSFDGNHCNGAGYRIIAENLSRNIVEKILKPSEFQGRNGHRTHR